MLDRLLDAQPAGSYNKCYLNSDRTSGFSIFFSYVMDLSEAESVAYSTECACPSICLKSVNELLCFDCSREIGVQLL